MIWLQDQPTMLYVFGTMRCSLQQQWHWHDPTVSRVRRRAANRSQEKNIVDVTSPKIVSSVLNVWFWCGSIDRHIIIIHRRVLHVRTA
jgi:hypothetical protein